MARDTVKLDGHKVEGLRLQAGLNRWDLSIRAGVSVNTVRKVLDGRPVTLSVGQAIARGLGVGFGDLLPASGGDASIVRRGAETPHHACQQVS
ncbi:MAG: helix-turn-helix transcriptional regulator [Phycisphaerae bacterium]|nr:helix-turn-helix transcriptional regulator [Phycisphaerae bacterium]